MAQNPIQKDKRKIRDDEIYKLYWETGLTYREIAKKHNLTFQRISQIIKKVDK